MIFTNMATKYLGGSQYLSPTTVIWSWSAVPGADVIVTYFDGLTTSMTLTGAGH